MSKLILLQTFNNLEIYRSIQMQKNQWEDSDPDQLSWESQISYFIMSQSLDDMHSYQRTSKYHYIPGKDPYHQMKVIMVGFLYFLQGILIVMPQIFPLSYNNLPSYHILSYFALTITPFGWKFIIAPFVESYTSVSYGPYKTWIMITTLIAGLLLLLMSQFTAEDQQAIAALLLFLVMLSIAAQDVSVDTITIKQFNHPQFVGFLQNVTMQSGSLLGGFLFIQLVAQDAWIPTYFGFATPIMTVEMFLIILGFLFLIPTIPIHFYFQERMTEQEELFRSSENKQSFWNVIKRYKYFLNPKYRVCRQIIVYLIYPHGISYFVYGFQYQVIRTYGFSQQTITTATSFSAFVMILASFFISKLIDKTHEINKCPIQNPSKEVLRIHKITNLQKIQRQLQILMVAMSVFVYFFMSFIVSHELICIFVVCAYYVLSKTMYFIDGIMTGSYASISKHPAMFGTALGSLSNIGKSGALPLKMIALMGYSQATTFSLILSGAFAYLLSHINKKVMQGLSEKPKLHEN